MYFIRQVTSDTRWKAVFSTFEAIIIYKKDKNLEILIKDLNGN